MSYDSNRQEELQNCNFVKTVLMIIVVLYHSVLFWKGTWFTGTPARSAPILVVLSNWMNSFHIYGFTLVSGYLFFFLKQEKGKYPRFLPFMLNKARRLLIPYAFVALVWVIPFSVYYFKYDVVDIVKRFVLGASPSQLWFLLMLFGVFVIFYPLSNFFERHNVYGAALVILFYGIGLIGQQILPNVFQLCRACSYLPLFWIGFKIRQYGLGWLRKIPAIAMVCFDIILFDFAQYVAGLDGVVFEMLNIGLEFMLHIIGAIMAFVVLQKVAELVNWKSRKTFVFLAGIQCRYICSINRSYMYAYFC